MKDKSSESPGPSAAAVPYPSLLAVKEQHAELLKRRRTASTEETFDEAQAFLHRAVATGALLDGYDDRVTVQSLIDYWVTVLYRAKRIPPDGVLEEFDPTLSPTIDEGLCPYVGLSAFKEDTKELFFGRSHLLETMLLRLRDNRLLAVMGPSGSGKSSIVLAGLLPLLKSGAIPGSDAWEYFQPMVPGQDPLRNLALATKGAECVNDEWLRQQISKFRETSDHLVRLVEKRGSSPGVLLIDQFEEIFTLCTNDEHRNAFVSNLVSLAQSTTRRHLLVLTMRTDFESRIMQLPLLEPLFSQGEVRITPLSPAELRQAIEEPAKKVGLRFEEGVVDSLVKEILGEPAGLPLLQFTLSGLWKRREGNRISLKAYRTLGGARHALAITANQLYHSLLIEEQETAKRILLRLARPTEGLEVTSNRIRKEVLYKAGEARDRINRVLARLIDTGLVRLTKGQLPGDDQIEVAHEALIRNWPMLVGWLDEERVVLRRRSLLTAAAEDWRDHGKDSSGLLEGSLLDEAAAYEDLSDLESEFVQASKAAVDAASKYQANQARRLNLWKQIALSVLVGIVSFALYYSFILKDQEELYRNTEGLLEELRHMQPDSKAMLSESRLDAATLYLLFGSKRANRLSMLKELLIKNEDLFPADYGIDRSGIELASVPALDADWPLSVHYSPDRELDELYFTRTWQTMAKFFVQTWGIPVPMQLKLIPDPSIGRNRVRLTGPETQTSTCGKPNCVEITVPTYEDKAFITSEKLPPEAQEFFDLFFKEWISIREGNFKWPWWAVPRWSLPVWKTAGHLATGGSGLPALLLAVELQKQPEPLFQQSAVAMLLNRAAAQYPFTVAEVQSARGDQLGQDLTELIRKGRSLVDLQLIFDMLASYPDKSTVEAAPLVDEDVQNAEVRLPQYFHGPWKVRLDRSKKPPAKINSSEIAEAYRDILRWLPPEKSPIRIYVGDSLRLQLTQGEDLAPTFIEALEDLRIGLFRQFGVELPAITVQPDPSIPPKAFRIEVLNQTATDEDVKPIISEVGKELHYILTALQFRAKGLRTYWVTADSVQGKKEQWDPALREWLDRHFALTDLKLLLRGIINPSREELGHRVTAKDEDLIEVPHNYSIRYQDWLLRSLVFWSRLENSRDVREMTRYLRDTQKARLEPMPPATKSNPSVMSYVAEGIRALETDRLDLAEKAFSRAIVTDRPLSIRAFLATYPQALRASFTRHFSKACKKPLEPDVTLRNSPYLRADLEDWIMQSQLKAEIKTTRDFKLCLLASLPDFLHQKHRALMADLLNHYGTPEDWPELEASWLAIESLAEYSPLTGDQQLGKKAELFLKSAIRHLDEKESTNAFVKVLMICEQSGPHNWCWQLLSDLAELRKDNHAIALDLAYSLSNREPAEQLERALLLADQVEKELGQRVLPSRERIRLGFAHLAKAKALTSLGVIKDRTYLSEAETLLLPMLNSHEERIARLAYNNLIEVEYLQERFQEAEAHLGEAIKKWPGYADNYGLKLDIQLWKGDESEVERVATDALQNAEKDGAFLFVAAIGQLLTRSGSWEVTSRQFIETNHDYVPYVAMMLYASMASSQDAKYEANSVLKRRWDKIKHGRAAWDDRLRAGDVTAWREKLIGYYMKEVDRTDIFGDLEDDTKFATSALRHIPLPRSGMLCEAYFYDALLARIRQDGEQMRTKLRKVLETRQSNYHEYAMAKFILGQKATDGEDGKP